MASSQLFAPEAIHNHRSHLSDKKRLIVGNLALHVCQGRAMVDVVAILHKISRIRWHVVKWVIKVENMAQFMRTDAVQRRGIAPRWRRIHMVADKPPPPLRCRAKLAESSVALASPRAKYYPGVLWLLDEDGARHQRLHPQTRAKGSMRAVWN